MRFDFFTNILFPPICVACRTRVAHGVICDACFSGIEIGDSIVCGECFAPFKSPVITQSTCHPNFPYILGAAGRYDDQVLQSLIHNLKFVSMRGAAEPIARLIADYVVRTRIDLTGFTAVPIPLSPRRRRARGFNQSELIARHLASFLEQNSCALPVATDILVREKHTKPQSDTASIAERRANILGAFKTLRDLHGTNILLIDDVSTSGATFLEASRALIAAGAGTILALAAAKT